MQTIKEQIVDLVADLPDNISWKQARHEIWILEQVQIGLEQVMRGETVPHEQVMKELDQWLGVSVGPKRRGKSSSSSRRGSKKTRLLAVNERI